MNTERKILRVCTAVIVFALLIRLFSEFWPGGISESHELASAFLFLQTGRLVRQAEVSPQPSETVPPTAESAPVLFSAEAAVGLQIYDYAGKQPDLAALLTRPLNWDLTQATPTVLIYHTHASESYENTEGYTASSDYRTLDESCNMLSVGARLQELLEQAGIGTVQDRSIHDHPSYNGAYSNSYVSARALIQQYPQIQLVLDIHRDAATDDTGKQIAHTVATPRGNAAKIMLVVGAGNENYLENMALAVKLQVQLEALCPGICRPICLRSSGFNQSLSDGALLIEMGAAGNTRQEALLAAEYVAEAIISLRAGSTS